MAVGATQPRQAQGGRSAQGRASDGLGLWGRGATPTEAQDSKNPRTQGRKDARTQRRGMAVSVRCCALRCGAGVWMAGWAEQVQVQQRLEWMVVNLLGLGRASDCPLRANYRVAVLGLQSVVGLRCAVLRGPSKAGRAGGLNNLGVGWRLPRPCVQRRGRGSNASPRLTLTCPAGRAEWQMGSCELRADSREACVPVGAVPQKSGFGGTKCVTSRNCIRVRQGAPRFQQVMTGRASTCDAGASAVAAAVAVAGAGAGAGPRVGADASARAAR